MGRRETLTTPRLPWTMAQALAQPLAHQPTPPGVPCLGAQACAFGSRPGALTTRRPCLGGRSPQPASRVMCPQRSSPHPSTPLAGGAARGWGPRPVFRRPSERRGKRRLLQSWSRTCREARPACASLGAFGYTGHPSPRAGLLARQVTQPPQLQAAAVGRLQRNVAHTSALPRASWPWLGLPGATSSGPGLHGSSYPTASFARTSTGTSSTAEAPSRTTGWAWPR